MSDIGRLEDELFLRLASPTMSGDLHRQSLERWIPNALADADALGLDTNTLKILRHKATQAEQLVFTMESIGSKLIVPGQCVVEFWNNHQVFASEDWNEFRNHLNGMRKRVDGSALGAALDPTVEQISSLVDQVTQDLQDSRDPDYLSRSTELLRLLLEHGTKPMVSRVRFAEMASVRQASRFPPGFADEKRKVSSFGDFFAWCDFLLGVLGVASGREGLRFLWVTDDAKPDWRTGGFGHPVLLEEFRRISGCELAIIGSTRLMELLAESERAAAEQESVGDTAE